MLGTVTAVYAADSFERKAASVSGIKLIQSRCKL